MEPEYRFRTFPRRIAIDDIGSGDTPYFRKSWLNILRAMNTGGQHVDQHTDARLLFDAIRKGKVHLTRFILEAAPGSIANACDGKGKTPLMISCFIQEQMRREMTARLLLNHGADVNKQDDTGRTALSYASEMKCNDIVELLIKHNDVDPDVIDHRGNTALIYSAIVGNDVATEMLTRHFRRLGLKVDHTNENGYTALLMASRYGNISCGKILVQQGQASLLHRDRTHGYSAQDWLRLNGYSLEDISPISSRSRSRAKFMKAVSITRLSLPRGRYAHVIVDSKHSGDKGPAKEPTDRKPDPLPKIKHAKVVPMTEKRRESRPKSEVLNVLEPECAAISSEASSYAESSASLKNITVLPPIRRENSIEEIVKVEDLPIDLKAVRNEILEMQKDRRTSGRSVLYVEEPEDIGEGCSFNQEDDDNGTEMYTLYDSDSTDEEPIFP